MSQPKLHMIGGAHIDPCGCGRGSEGFHEVKATFRSALDRMKIYRIYLVASSSAFYEWVEQSDRHVRRDSAARHGRPRQLVGGWWIEPDCNIPSGEAFVRRGCKASTTIKKSSADRPRRLQRRSFGHAGTIPQILKKSGIPY